MYTFYAIIWPLLRILLLDLSSFMYMSNFGNAITEWAWNFEKIYSKSSKIHNHHNTSWTLIKFIFWFVFLWCQDSVAFWKTNKQTNCTLCRQTGDLKLIELYMVTFFYVICFKIRNIWGWPISFTLTRRKQCETPNDACED